MEKHPQPLQWLVWSALIATIVGIIAAFTWSRFINPPAANLPIISHVPEFVLTNQDSRAFTRTALLDHVTIANIIFTRCAGPCPEMTRKMSSLQRLFPADAPVQFVTLTTDPGYDSPEVLKQYGSRFNADFSRWHFLTGPKPEIKRLAVQGLKLVAEEVPASQQTTPEDLFIHSTIFVIVDKQGRIRGSFDSSEADFEKSVRAATRRLLKERGR